MSPKSGPEQFLDSYISVRYNFEHELEKYPFPARLALVDFTPSNARRFYSSMGNPLGRKGVP